MQRIFVPKTNGTIILVLPQQNGTIISSLIITYDDYPKLALWLRAWYEVEILQVELRWEVGFDKLDYRYDLPYLEQDHHDLEQVWSFLFAMIS
jgi:hypothetical protein